MLISFTSRYLTEFLSKSGHDPENFREVCVENLPLDEEMIACCIFM